MSLRRSLPFAVLAVSASLVSACAAHRAGSRQDAGAAAKALAASPTEAGRAVEAEPDVRDMDLREVPELKTVRFAYDSDFLDEAARAALKGNAVFLKAHPAMKVQVQGHCDQRGTVAYNLALGQRRAASVRAYYKALGVAADRVATISYGEERPLCSDATEECWSRNRRAETLEALNANVAGSPR